MHVIYNENHLDYFFSHDVFYEFEYNESTKLN